jgi:hypothetical protein
MNFTFTFIIEDIYIRVIAIIGTLLSLLLLSSPNMPVLIHGLRDLLQFFQSRKTKETCSSPRPTSYIAPGAAIIHLPLNLLFLCRQRSFSRQPKSMPVAVHSKAYVCGRLIV